MKHIHINMQGLKTEATTLFICSLQANIFEKFNHTVVVANLSASVNI
jgi:hypothetical protein